MSLAVACSGSRTVTGKWVVEKMLPAQGAPAAPPGMPPMRALLKRASDEEVARRVGAKPERIPPPPIQALADNGLARTPPMGWNSWNCFHLDVSDAKVREVADAMVKTGMRDAGYQYLVIDDGCGRGRSRTAGSPRACSTVATSGRR